MPAISVRLRCEARGVVEPPIPSPHYETLTRHDLAFNEADSTPWLRTLAQPSSFTRRCSTCLRLYAVGQSMVQSTTGLGVQLVELGPRKAMRARARDGVTAAS